ncbi:MAG TPA: hypothetical protein VGH00_04870, partial [Chthoniobacterales bacterium]
MSRFRAGLTRVHSGSFDGVTGPTLFRCLALGFCAFGAVARGEPVEQSVSTSRQFIVYGTDLGTRGAICDFAEQTKRELLSLLAQRDNWTAAIVINGQYPLANLPEVPRLSVDLG